MALKLVFVTLTTGQSVTFERMDIPDSVISAIQLMLRQGGTLTDGWSVEILHSTPEAAVFDVFYGQSRVTHCWLCIAPTASDRLWNAATVGGLPDVRAKQPEMAPWVAVHLARDIVTIVEQPSRMMEAAQAEIGVCWALIDQAYQL